MLMTEHHKPTRHSPADTAEQVYRKSSYRAIRNLKCSFRDGVLSIEGCLPSFHLKQLALTAVQNIDGVDRIDDRVEVAK
jgi:hypothetical protein